MGLENADTIEHPLWPCWHRSMWPTPVLSTPFFTKLQVCLPFPPFRDSSTLVERIRQRLVDLVGDDDLEALIGAVESGRKNARGGATARACTRVPGTSIATMTRENFSRYVRQRSPTKRAPADLTFLATFLIIAKRSGSSTFFYAVTNLRTSRPRRLRSRSELSGDGTSSGFLLELQPMCDMLSCIATMRSSRNPGDRGMWHLADLPGSDTRTTRSSTPCPRQPPSLPAQTCGATDGCTRSRESVAISFCLPRASYPPRPVGVEGRHGKILSSTTCSVMEYQSSLSPAGTSRSLKNSVILARLR